MKMVRLALVSAFALLAAMVPGLAATNVPFSTYISGQPAASAFTGTERLVILKSGMIQTMTPVQILQMMSGDCAQPGASIVCTKINGIPFSAGTAITPGTDFNILTTAGRYYSIDNTSANTPTAQTYYLVVEVGASGGIKQTATAQLDGTSKSYVRTKESGSWTAWKRVMLATQATCADLSNAAASCAIDATNATNIGTGTLNTLRLPSPFTSGTASGNTSKFMTGSGSFASGHIAGFDANGNIIDGFTPSGNTSTAVTAAAGAKTSGHVVTWDASGNVQDGGGALTNGTVTEQKNTAGSGLTTSGNCDNTSTNSASPCQYSINAGVVPGIATGTAAAAGNVGEVILSSTTTGSLTSGSTTAATSITLTAGDWDISAVVDFQTAGATSVTDWFAAISTTSGTVVSSIPNSGIAHERVTATNDHSARLSFPPTQVLPTANTTYYLNIQSTFTGTAPTANVFLRARRMR
ncbi:hypothetical protein ACRQ5Q_15225 [Bradyrhizobium sp. PMVTL-01]|uniref:hypothetical protein n=1 Tax=Bradyrhizobium sp. PMVTL-01 TaxID=3434999 RepID=UPI003F7028EE